MKNKQIDGTEVWKQLEDMLVPRLRLTVTERAVYSYLVRHSRLEGKLRAHFSIAGSPVISGCRWGLREMRCAD